MIFFLAPMRVQTILFDIEDYRSIHEDRRHRAGGSGNWTSREDWDYGDYDDDGMSGFDSYEDNDF